MVPGQCFSIHIPNRSPRFKGPSVGQNSSDEKILFADVSHTIQTTYNYNLSFE
jgi:hypothetical protein